MQSDPPSRLWKVLPALTVKQEQGELPLGMLCQRCALPGEGAILQQDPVEASRPQGQSLFSLRGWTTLEQEMGAVQVQLPSSPLAKAQKHFLISGAHLLPRRTHSWTMTTACTAQLACTHSPERTHGQSTKVQPQFCPGLGACPPQAAQAEAARARGAVGAPHQNSRGVGWLSSRDPCERGWQMRR